MNDSVKPCGFRMPAEWHPHSATWMAWPKNRETWPEHLSEARDAFVQMIEHLTKDERVRLLIPSSGEEAPPSFSLEVEPRIDFISLPYNDSWMRDAGPIFVHGSEAEAGLAAYDFIFNAWGKKYEPWDDDDAIPSRALASKSIPVYPQDLVLEGGSIDVNGRGTLITTEQCLLNPNRNPGLDRSGIEVQLKHLLGVERILWLGEGIEGDDTDGHVDDITRFVDETTVITMRASKKSDPNFFPLEENFKKLKRLGDQDGNKLTVVDLPMPDIELTGPFGRSPASYANFYIANKRVLVPVYGAPNEESVFSSFRDLFPDREIIPIDCTGLVCGLGAIHCVTQQEPLPVSAYTKSK